MQEPSRLGKAALVSIWFRMVIIQIIARVVYKDSPSRYPYWSDMTILIPTGRFLLPLMMLIIDTMHSPIYWCNIGANINLIRSAYLSVRIWLVNLPIFEKENTLKAHCKSGNSYIA